MNSYSISIAIAAAGLAMASLHALPTIAMAGGKKGETIMTQGTTQPERNKAMVQERFAAWANGTGSPFELLAEDATWTITGRSAASKTYANREAFLRDVIRPFNARMQAPLKPTVHNIYADGDAVVIFFDASTVARDGKPYTNTYTWYFDMRDGKVVKATAMFDSIEFNDLWSRVQPSQ
jgi:ketosteroid isomerase-like protein